VQLGSDVHQLRCEEYGCGISHIIGHHGLPQLAVLPPFPYGRTATRSVPNRMVCFEFPGSDGAVSRIVDDFLTDVYLLSYI